MTLGRIVDFHIHLCRSVAQEKAVFPRAGWPDEWYWGNPDAIIDYLDRWNVSHAVTLNIMRTDAMIRRRVARDGDDSPKRLAELAEEMRQRVRDFNDWACDFHKQQPRVIPFVMVDPVLFGTEVVDEVERCLARGAKGLKVHPSICGHMPDDKRILPVYDLCLTRGVPILTDTTGNLDPDGGCVGAPLNWRPVLRQFKGLKIVLAHLCGERWDEHLELADEFGDDIRFDMSGGFVDATHPLISHRCMPLQEGQRVFRRIGADRILFGTDGPAHHREVPDTVSQLLQLKLSSEENEKILSKNAVELLGLPR